MNGVRGERTRDLARAGLAGAAVLGPVLGPGLGPAPGLVSGLV
jgi:hypothetical protein